MSPAQNANFKDLTPEIPLTHWNFSDRNGPVQFVNMRFYGLSTALTF